MVGLGDEGRAFSGELTGIAVQNTTGLLAGIVVQVRPDAHAPDTDSEEGVLNPGERLLSKLDAQVLEGVVSGASTVQLAARLYLEPAGRRIPRRPHAAEVEGTEPRRPRGACPLHGHADRRPVAPAGAAGLHQVATPSPPA
ncbi:hypothetical protein ACQ4WX_50290 [Streptomyces lasalocidi]